MVPFDTDRPRLAEDDYFRRRDEELLSRAREARLSALEQQALADVLGTHDSEVVNELHGHGMRAEHAVLLEWLPAVEVAWLDGADDAEHEVLRRRFAADERASDACAALLDEWLSRRPPEGFFLAARRALRCRLHTLEDAARRATLDRIVSICEAAGRAAGGVFGIAALSSDERRHIEFIRRELERSLSEGG